MDNSYIKNKKSISKITTDKYMIGRAVLAAISFNEELLSITFNGKLTTDDMREINKKRSNNLTKINEGIYNRNEIKYIRDSSRKLQRILAVVLYRICNIDENNGDIIKLNKISEQLRIRINVYNINKEKILSIGSNYLPIISLLIDNDNTFMAINNVIAFTF